jgi:hypothetical protein
MNHPMILAAWVNLLSALAIVISILAKAIRTQWRKEETYLKEKKGREEPLDSPFQQRLTAAIDRLAKKGK